MDEGRLDTKPWSLESALRYSVVLFCSKPPLSCSQWRARFTPFKSLYPLTWASSSHTKGIVGHISRQIQVHTSISMPMILTNNWNADNLKYMFCSTFFRYIHTASNLPLNLKCNKVFVISLPRTGKKTFFFFFFPYRIIHIQLLCLSRPSDPCPVQRWMCDTQRIRLRHTSWDIKQALAGRDLRVCPATHSVPGQEQVDIVHPWQVFN